VFEQWRWIGDVSKLATAPPIPPWIVSAIRAPKPIEYSASPSACDAGKRERAYAERAINNVAAKVAGTPRGSRNSELNAAAFSMGTMLACNWIGRATV